MGGVFPMESTLPSTRLALVFRHWLALVGIDAHRLLIDCSWIAHGEFIGWHWLASTGEAGGWQGGLFNHVPPARHRPYIALFFSLIFLMDGSLIAHCRFRERFGGC